MGHCMVAFASGRSGTKDNSVKVSFRPASRKTITVTVTNRTSKTLIFCNSFAFYELWVRRKNGIYEHLANDAEGMDYATFGTERLVVLPQEASISINIHLEGLHVPSTADWESRFLVGDMLQVRIKPLGPWAELIPMSDPDEYSVLVTETMFSDYLPAKKFIFDE